MLVGVLADSHDNLTMLQKSLMQLEERGAEMILHAGDIVAPFSMKLLLKPGLPFVAVFGNNDGERAGLKKLCGNIYEQPHRFDVGGRTVVLAHEEDALSRALDPDVEIAICAHTHRPSIDSTGPLMINPGEVGAWLTGRSTGVLLDLDECSAEILEFGRQEVPQL